MRLTRWKLMAGALGLSMCGLAALAEPACRSVGITRRADEPKPADDPKPVEGAKPLPLPAPAAPPPVTEVPPPVIVPSGDPKPTTPPPVPESKPIALPPVNDPKTPPAVDFNLLKAVDNVQSPPTPLPGLPEPKKGDALPPPIPVPAPTPPAPVKADVPPTIDLVPVKNEKPEPVTPLPAPDKKADTPPPAPPSEKKAEPVPPPVFSEPPPAAVPPKPAGVMSKKLKVMLHLSDDKPWFEVKDGDEVVLKVTAEAVQLNATAEKGRPAGVLVATGSVTFRTLGGYGTCDELHVMPGTGEVVVTGKVTVTSNWGKAETTATADKMTFRLGGDAKK
jgi:hypothetical protein